MKEKFAPNKMKKYLTFSAILLGTVSFSMLCYLTPKNTVEKFLHSSVFINAHEGGKDLVRQEKCQKLTNKLEKIEKKLEKNECINKEEITTE